MKTLSLLGFVAIASLVASGCDPAVTGVQQGNYTIGNCELWYERDASGGLRVYSNIWGSYKKPKVKPGHKDELLIEVEVMVMEKGTHPNLYVIGTGTDQGIIRTIIRRNSSNLSGETQEWALFKIDGFQETIEVLGKPAVRFAPPLKLRFVLENGNAQLQEGTEE